MSKDFVSPVLRGLSEEQLVKYDQTDDPHVTLDLEEETQRLSSSIIEATDTPTDVLVDTLLLRAIVYNQQGNVKEELQDLDKLISLEKASIEKIIPALFFRSFIYHQQENVDKELQDLNRLIEIKFL